MNRQHFNLNSWQRNILLGLLILSPFSYSPAYSQNEGKWYDVEVLIFKRLDVDPLATENWRNNLELSYPTQYQYLQTDTEEENFQLRPKEEHQLGGYIYTLQRNESYRVLYHQAWRQQMQGKEASPSIIVRGGEELGNNNQKELEGYIKIHIARYLHLTTDLWLTIARDEADEEVSWPLLPLPPGETVSATTVATSNQRPVDNINLSTLPLNYEFSINNQPISLLRERRRMRSKELHYIDHPLMGLLILITPIEQ